MYCYVPLCAIPVSFGKCSILSQNRHPFPMQPTATAYGAAILVRDKGGTVAEGLLFETILVLSLQIDYENGSRE